MMTTIRKDAETARQVSKPHSNDHEAAAVHQHIASIAYLKAEARGFLPGHELDDWLEAEVEINGTISHDEKH